MEIDKKVYTPAAYKVLRRALDIAYNFDYQVVGTEHLLAALVAVSDTMAENYFQDRGVTYDAIIEQISTYSSGNVFNKADMEWSPRLDKILGVAAELAQFNGFETVGTEFIFAALLAEDNCFALQILDGLSVDMQSLYKQIVEDNGIKVPQKRSPKAVVPMSQRGRQRQRSDAKSSTPTLDSVATDMTALARRDGFDPVIGRETEIERMVHVLARRTKNNPVLVGDPGVGKTAIVEGLALRIASGEVPTSLANVRLMALNMANIVAGTSLRGEFEDRMVAIVNEVRKDPDVIVFIDELHSIMGGNAGAEGAADASNILKPALARGDFQLIGATTFKEYQRYIEKDEALERRFARIVVDEPTEEEATKILEGLAPRYADYHEVAIDPATLSKIVELAVRYIPERRLPDKALDILDEACARVKVAEKNGLTKVIKFDKELAELRGELPEAVASLDLKRARAIRSEIDELVVKSDKAKKTSPTRKAVTMDDVYTVLSNLTGVPTQQMSKSEAERLVNLEKELHKRVIGQDEAVEAVARAIRRARSGVADMRRPMGSFMFLGPTGVGKTELAKALAQSVFGSEEAMIRVDMSEYMEKFSTSRLIGAPPGYIGYEEGGQLTEQVRNKPYSVVLLDEAEKAHPDVFNVLLQILDDGYVTDTKGRRIDFRNTIIIMTSNLGATSLRDDKTVGFGAVDWSQDYEAMKARILKELKATYRPEFLNRIDETIVFHSLTEAELTDIVKLLAADVINRLKKQTISLKLSLAALKCLAKSGFDPEYGARPLRKAIERDLEDPLSTLLLTQELQAGNAVSVGVSGDKLNLKVEK
ncbi:MAG: ATP-dependent Clp protease ATP-binding subunit [Streptococcaceae bacterium]|jgi:ATP-dependent Clp protease ATP-binding subunit ClpC|nr:ATP-dependent Clp protease ATP-binding subunit [Streptococcaceae bacterium]